MTAAKLVVEVLDAADLMPKDGEGSASPYVEVDFDNQRQKTQTRFKDLNPVWNHKLVFDIPDLRQLPDNTIEVTVYNDRKSGHAHPSNFLGRVRISGSCISPLESEAKVQRFPLDKRGLFSSIKGDIALRIYLTHDLNFSPPPPPQQQGSQEEKGEVVGPPLEEINPNIKANGGDYRVNEEREIGNENHGKKSKKKKEKDQEEVRTFYSMPAKSPTPPATTTLAPENFQPPPPKVEFRADFMRPGPPPPMMMQVPGKKPEYNVIETRPPVAAHMGYRRGDNTGSTYDLVEQMHYLYVRVVKARDLPVMDITGSLDPYVEVKLGNYKGVTKHLEKNQNPVWNQVFAFSKERLQSHLLEVAVKDKDCGLQLSTFLVFLQSVLRQF